MSFIDQTGKTIVYVLLKNYKIISAVIAVLVLGFGTLLILSPKYDTIQNQGLLNADAKTELLAARQEYLVGLNSMINKYRTISQAQVDRLSQVLPPEQQLPELFVMLDQIGRDAGFEVERINLSPQSSGSTAPAKAPSSETGESGVAPAPTGLSKISSIGIVVGVKTESLTYGKFKQMLEILEQNIRIFDVTSISYGPDAESFTINMTTYYLES